MISIIELIISTLDTIFISQTNFLFCMIDEMKLYVTSNSTNSIAGCVIYPEVSCTHCIVRNCGQQVKSEMSKMKHTTFVDLTFFLFTAALLHAVQECPNAAHKAKLGVSDDATNASYYLQPGS
jgi:hypothetical protein